MLTTCHKIVSEAIEYSETTKEVQVVNDADKSVELVDESGDAKVESVEHDEDVKMEDVEKSMDGEMGSSDEIEIIEEVV